ncbi:MAG: sugar ABC transporter ATP-binding protein [Anaerolineaceae bacterium]|nr:sugar ABC transporter ATP-binding protein [Anaerolineaceae bacterium]
MNPTALVEIRRVSLSFVAVQALQDIDLFINQGDIHALVGENGAGKSTLGKVISGIERPDDGDLLINGELRQYTHPRDALRDGITTITQEIALLNNQSVLHNVLLGQELCRAGVLQRGRMLAEFERLVELTGFSLDPDEKVGNLHMADQRKVEVLQAVARDSRLIIMDEPTAMLADDETRVFLDIVRNLQRSGHTIIYISHFLEEVLELADVVTVMRNGRIVRTAPTAEETTHSLVEAMLGRSMLEMYPTRQAPAPDAAVLLEVRGLEAQGLGSVDLQLRAGEITGLAGLVGSGRSRLARTLFGALERDAGEILVRGEAVQLNSTSDAIQAGVFMLPESRKEQGLLLKQSIRSNLSLPHMDSVVGRAGVISRTRESNRIGQLLKLLNVVPPEPRLIVNRLSGGNQQKVLFGKWLFEQPTVFIVDEPTRGIDIGARRAIYELVVELASQGVAILLISSEIEEIIGLAHRSLVMRLGSIVAEIEAGEDGRLDEQAIMQAAFGAETLQRAVAGGEAT